MVVALKIQFFVDGVPVPQGSKSAWVNGPRAVMFDDNAKLLKPWRKTVTTTARAAFAGRNPIEGPVFLEARFQFVKPKTVRRGYPSVKPDLSKLLRALEDGITDAGVWRDDALVVTAHVSKIYAERTGVQVRICEYRKAV